MDIPCSTEDVCEPIKTVDHLRRSANHGWNWSAQVKPLAQKSIKRCFNDDFYDMNAKSSSRESNGCSDVLVCHDYKGNYLSDKFIRNECKDWDDYRFYNWSGVDIFCYFSHNFVTIPTLQFLNAAHTNGVKIIGTIIFEHGDGTKNLSEILKSREMVEECTEALVNIARKLKFEGWFFNVEVSLPPVLIEMLKYFVQHLTQRIHEEIPFGRVIWYDSINEDGGLVWQNELNSKNENFFALSDGIFTNYNWKIENLDRSSSMIDAKYPARRKDVYVGLDVFGRGQLAGFSSSSTVSKIMPYDFSIAIFAPGWTHEVVDVSKFFCEPGSDEWREKMNSSFLERNDRFWNSLTKFFHLDGPVTLPFATNFSLGSGKNMYRLGAKIGDAWFNMKHQNFMPSTPAKQGVFKYYYNDAFQGGNSIKVEAMGMTRLLVCDFNCDDDLIFASTIKRYDDLSNDLQFRLNLRNSTNGQITAIYTETVAKTERSMTIKRCDSDGETKDIERFLSSQNYATFPHSINGWETRYFYMKFANKKVKVTDIGFKKVSEGKLLLGHLAIYPAKDFIMTNCDNVNIINL